METNEVSRIVKPSQLKGAKEVTAAAESVEPSVSTQNVPSTLSLPDWSNHAQQFYHFGATPHPFYTTSTPVSPNFYPYVLNQHQLMQVYGTSVQYPAQYKHNQLPAYPNINGQGVVLTVPIKVKNPNEKDLGSMRKCKGISESKSLVETHLGESGNRTLPSGERGDGALQRAAIGIEDSSDESGVADKNMSAAKKQRFNQRLVDGATLQTDSTSRSRDVNTDLALQDSVVNMARTNANMGMNLSWSSPQAILPKDENDQRKERRKQSNRESAKRSRLRRQQECEKLQATVEVLRGECSTLKNEYLKVYAKCSKLVKEIDSTMDEMEETHGPDAVSDLRAERPGPFSFGGENNNNEQRISSASETPDNNGGNSVF
ncbi:hypothetical protein FNV43_RR22707 [Rhamnella rubrinervis]|uniref:BZIP domain-containing protein n=1 Tax=Rhamnella rubrinervis TaxID=2594499 RepID=A0A8K0DVQ5_9ROSA|nr:hypothetical protein FNV43_RR22707 [Rhamnella rubrinervis]